MIKFGDKKINKIYFGDKKIVKVYFGDKLVWSAEKNYKFDINYLKADELFNENEQDFPLGRPLTYFEVYIDSNKEVQIKNLGMRPRELTFGDESKLVMYIADGGEDLMYLLYRSSSDKGFYYNSTQLIKKDMDFVKQLLSGYIIEDK